jgi:protein tyrosine/serine phosphatase
MERMTVQDAQARWINLDGAVNVRTVVPRVLLRSDNLQALSARDVDCLIEEHRLEVVVDLRTPSEVELEGPGPLMQDPRVRVVHHSLYPTSGRTDLDVETIKPGAAPWGPAYPDDLRGESPLVRSYAGYILARPDSVVAAVREIAAADGSVLVHCAAGKDRTGMVVALALDAAGVSRERIAEDYLATGQRIEQIIDRLRASETYKAELAGHDPQDHAPVPGTIERALEVVDWNYGGAVGWLLVNGLRRHELARLRERLSRSH